MKRTKLTKADRNKLIREWMKDLIIALHDGNVQETKKNGINHSFLTYAVRLGYITKIKNGWYDPKVLFTDEIINNVYKAMIHAPIRVKTEIQNLQYYDLFVPEDLKSKEIKTKSGVELQIKDAIDILNCAIELLNLLDNGNKDL